MTARGARLFGLLLFCVPGAAHADDACSTAHVRAQLLKRDAPESLLDRRTALRSCTSRLCPRSIVDACSTWLREVDALVPNLAVKPVDASGMSLDESTLFIDGKTRPPGQAIDLDPGEHTITIATSRAKESRK